MQSSLLYLGLDVPMLSKYKECAIRIMIMITRSAQCRILKDSGSFLVKIPRGLELSQRGCVGQCMCIHLF